MTITQKSDEKAIFLSGVEFLTGSSGQVWSGKFSILEPPFVSVQETSVVGQFEISFVLLLTISVLDSLSIIFYLPGEIIWTYQRLPILHNGYYGFLQLSDSSLKMGYLQ